MIQKPNILYVDDEIDNLELFEFHMQKSFHVFTAETGREGLEILENNSKIEVVFSDLKMTGMNGVEFIKMAKDKYPGIYFFIFTGYDITQEIFDAIKNKYIEHYFQKPCSMKKIRAFIEDLLIKKNK